MLQSRGTADVGRLFGPVMLRVVRGAGRAGRLADRQEPVGAAGDQSAPRRLPRWPIRASASSGRSARSCWPSPAPKRSTPTWAISAARPIRTAWLWLRHAGPAAQLFRPGRADHRQDPTVVRQVFFELVPQDYIIGLVVARRPSPPSIASQAVITGVFSLTRQAIQLGYLPRMAIQHTSETTIGQIYIPRGQLAPDGRHRGPGRWASARRAPWPAPMASPSPAPCWSMPRSRRSWRSWCGSWSLAGRRPGVRLAGHSRPRLLHRQRAQDPRRRLVAAGRGLVDLLHHHDLAAWPPPGRHRDERRQPCR